jgi:hypothetical protein
VEEKSSTCNGCLWANTILEKYKHLTTHEFPKCFSICDPVRNPSPVANFITLVHPLVSSNAPLLLHAFIIISCFFNLFFLPSTSLLILSLTVINAFPNRFNPQSFLLFSAFFSPNPTPQMRSIHCPLRILSSILALNVQNYRRNKTGGCSLWDAGHLSLSLAWCRDWAVLPMTLTRILVIPANLPVLHT